jgi:hypothetical protein
MLKDSIIQIIKEMFVALFYSFTQVFFWITFTFVCMERFTKAKEIRSWNPDDLLSTSIPVNKQISKWEVFFSLWTTLWPVVLVNFGWYRFHNGTTVSYPLFNQEILMTYLPAIIGVVVIGVGIVIYKLIKAEWTKPLVGLNAAYHLIFAILLCLMLSNPNLFNQESINALFRYTGIDPNHWLMIIWGIVGLVIVSSIVDVYLRACCIIRIKSADVRLRLGHKSRYVAMLLVSLWGVKRPLCFSTTDAENTHIKRL